MLAALIAAAVTTTPVPPASPTPRPNVHPALWVVNDEDTIIYLFGTFHALDGKSEWFNDEVRTAFSGSEELVLETIVPDSLKKRVPQRPAPQGVGMQTVGPFAGSASFLSTSKMVMSAGRSQGMSTDHGADAILREAADDAGMPVKGLETFDFQLGMFGKMPGAKPPANPTEAARTKAAVAAVLAQLQSDWNRGDVEGFVPMLEQMEARSPATYKLLFNDRNNRWAFWIAKRLRQPGVVFVAVGAGHLAGKDSVQQKLSLYGIRTARVN
ncbi:TraB/GumN family protein [Sphingomonas daechungensis]|uniref:TraB/GumN family protein n=1 Tax=Sphingomonas daechungensis TaxID=1176646 RepID=A0ABX6T274_9SPHN|nr:TraB/GumN family protein [Sphingomonas daechungensis]QNP43318.1 TraB/GumN family protein [Sphingomonas daechungensis]